VLILKHKKKKNRGSMRLGSDLIMITKKDNVITVLLLSRQFYTDANITEVLICLPCFNATNKKPIYYKQENGKDNIDRFELEMDLIFKYSPFKNKDELEAQFDKIKSESGTLCNIFNLKLNEDGETELDIETDPEDILMRKNDIVNFKMYVFILNLNIFP